MKKYIKPEIMKNSLLTKETISNLATWLEGSNYESVNCNITTYDMQS